MFEGDLAAMWENHQVIRSRFRRDMGWLQWPTSCRNDTEDEPADAKHPVCTRSLELNAAAIFSMLEFFDGKFIDIGRLQNEALGSLTLLLRSPVTSACVTF